MSRPASQHLRVAPEFARLVRRFARLARAGAPRRMGDAVASFPAITARLAAYLERDAYLASAEAWRTPDMGALLDALPEPPE